MTVKTERLPYNGPTTGHTTRILTTPLGERTRARVGAGLVVFVLVLMAFAFGRAVQQRETPIVIVSATPSLPHALQRDLAKSVAAPAPAPTILAPTATPEAPTAELASVEQPEAPAAVVDEAPATYAPEPAAVEAPPTEIQGWVIHTASGQPINTGACVSTDSGGVCQTDWHPPLVYPADACAAWRPPLVYPEGCP